jgi:hypothetical protein
MLDTQRELIYFPVEGYSMIEGEKNKQIIIFLNQLDLKLGDHPSKQELRTLFLDCMNGFARFSRKLLQSYLETAHKEKSKKWL